MITGILAGIGAVIVFVVSWIIKGMLAQAGKEGAKHVYQNRDEYGNKIKGYWKKRQTK